MRRQRTSSIGSEAGKAPTKLAAAMAPLNKLTFQKTGTPHFDDDECSNPSMVRNLVWATKPGRYVDIVQEWHEQPTFESLSAYWNHLNPNGFVLKGAGCTSFEEERLKEIFALAVDCLPE